MKINPLEFEADEPEPDIRIKEAKLDSKQLCICFSPSFPNYRRFQATIVIRRPVPAEPIVITQKLEESDRIEVDLTDAAKKYCEESAFLRLELKTGSQTFSSDCHWVSTQVIERIPMRRDIDLFEKTNGRIGLIRIMNQLENASNLRSTMLYYLQKLDFDWLGTQLDRERKRRFMRYSGDDFEGEYKSRQEELLTADEILQKLIQRHDKRFERMPQELKQTDDVQGLTQRMFDLFLFLTKIAIWFKIRGLVTGGIRADIIERMRVFVGTKDKYLYMAQGFGCFDKVIEKIGKSKFLEIYENLAVPFHFLVISRILLRLSTNLSPGKRQTLKKQLSRIVAASFIYDEGFISNPSLRNRLKGAIQEYDEFECFILSEKMLLEQAKDVSRHATRRAKCSKCGKYTVYRVETELFMCPRCAQKTTEITNCYYINVIQANTYRGNSLTKLEASLSVKKMAC